MSVNKLQGSKSKIDVRFRELRASKELKEGRKLTYEIIAHETGVTIHSIQRWNNNNVTQFSASHLVKFCNYFGCEISDLLVLVDEDAEEDSSEGEYKESFAA